MPVTAVERQAAAPAPPTGDGADGVVRVYDQYGRAVTIGREAWRRDVLLPNLAANQGNADSLYELVVGAVQMTSTEEVEANLERARDLVREAASAGALLVGLPENFAYLGS